MRAPPDAAMWNILATYRRGELSMDKIISFPQLDDREWAWWRDQLRNKFATNPDDVEMWDECLPVIQAIWFEMFSGVVKLSRSLDVHIPAPITQEQIDAIKPACDACGESFVKQLRAERSKHFLMFVRREFDAARLRRNGDTH
jgi:hypothetical protein